MSYHHRPEDDLEGCLAFLVALIFALCAVTFLIIFVL